MTAEKVYQDLIARGVKLSIQGELLTFSAPKGTLNAELLGLLKKHKPALIEIVKTYQSAATSQTKSYLASYGQEALWLVHQTQPKSASYHTAAALRITSPIDVDAMQRALNKLVGRHESLRSTFEQRELQLYIRVKDSPVADFRVIDVAGQDEQQIHQAIVSEYAEPFDLAKGPLFRTRLFTERADRHVILLTLHHIIFDASSLWLLQSELQTLYAAEASGVSGLLPSLDATYEDFAKWQRELPDSDLGKRQWEYWKKELDGDPVPAELPWTSQRPKSGERKAATYSCHLDQELGVGLRILAKKLSATPFATAMSVFQALVYRHSHQKDFIVGTTTNGRTQPQFNSGIGYYVNVLPVRSSFDRPIKFSDLVQQTKQRLLDAMQASDFPFPLLVKRLNPVRTSNAAPLCRMVFGLQNPHAFSEVSQLFDCAEESINWGGLKAQSYKLNQQEGQFDLTMELYQSTHSFTCVFKYDENLLSKDAAKRFTGHYLKLLESIIADPCKEIDQYPITSELEIEQLLGWSAGPDLDNPVSENVSVPGNLGANHRYDFLWNESVAKYCGQLALIFQKQSWTYEQLDAYSDLVADYYRDSGVTPGDVVVVSIPRQPLVPVCMLAALKCGAAYVPVSPDSPEPRFIQIVSECKPKIVVTLRNPDDITGKIPPIATTFVEPCQLDQSVLAKRQKESAGGNQESPNSEPTQTESRALNKSSMDFDPESTAYIIYTSGSSGVPKGVAVSHAAITRHVRSMANVYEMQSDDRVLQFCDLTFDPSLEQFLTPWSLGASVVMRPETMYTGDGFWREIQQQNITIANVPPSFFSECSHYLENTGSLRLVIVGGDVFPVSTLPKWKSTGVRLLNAYGPTEAVITATTKEMIDFDPSQRLTIGVPKPGSTAYVLTSNSQLSPIGVPGELVLGGPMLATGYIGDATEVNHRFQSVSIEGKQEERIYRTGDLARWTDDGEIEFLGRLDRQIKIRGFRVEPGEVESALLQFSGIKDAFVRLAKDSQHPYLAAYLILDEDCQIDHDRLVQHLKSILPIYMVPERIATLEYWPLNDAGKIAVERLPQIAKPDFDSAHQFVPPRTPLENVLAAVWREVLEVESVGIHDDFYRLGGGSLQSLRIISRLRELGVTMKDESTEMSPHLLFQYVTIAELSGLLVLIESRENVAANP